MWCVGCVYVCVLDVCVCVDPLSEHRVAHRDGQEAVDVVGERASLEQEEEPYEQGDTHTHPDQGTA